MNKQYKSKNNLKNKKNTIKKHKTKLINTNKQTNIKEQKIGEKQMV